MLRMRFLAVSAAAAGAVLLLSVPVMSHPADAIKAEFSPEKKNLAINVSHPVKNTNRHYIEKIEIYSGKKLLVSQSFEQQSSAAGQKVSYVVIDAEEGTELLIKTRCNIRGSLEGYFMVTKTGIRQTQGKKIR